MLRYSEYSSNKSRLKSDRKTVKRFGNTPVTPLSFLLHPSEGAENVMLPEDFEQVQSSGRPSSFR